MTMLTTLGAPFMMDVLSLTRDEHRHVGWSGKWKENPSERCTWILSMNVCIDKIALN